MNSWVSGALTVLSSGIVAAMATAAFNLRASERQLRRTKLEDLCAILRKSNHRLRRLLRFARLAEKDQAQREAMQARIEAMGHEMPPDENFKAMALIAIYFPSLQRWMKAVADIEKEVENLRNTDNVTAQQSIEVLERTIAARERVVREAMELASSINAPIWMFWR